MLPIILPEDRLIFGASEDGRAAPAQFAEFFETLTRVALAQGNEREQHAYTCMALAAREAQVFEFGDVAEPFLIEEATLGGKLMGAGLLQPPYRSVLYWYTLTHPLHVAYDGPERLRYATLVATLDENRYIITDFIATSPELDAKVRQGARRSYAPGSVELRAIDRARVLFLTSGTAIISARPDHGWQGTLINRAGQWESRPEAALETMGSLADGVAGLSMVLATKGVGLRREAAPHKLNAKRAKAGKPALPTVTHVDLRTYREAAERTAKGGTHASPCPHLRRGHIRTYKDGHQTWVNSMLVNCRSAAEIQRRDHYEVKA